MLLTRLPLGIATSFDLHVLGTPPALILSQDQTLHKILMEPLMALNFADYINRTRLRLELVLSHTARLGSVRKALVINCTLGRSSCKKPVEPGFCDLPSYISINPKIKNALRRLSFRIQRPTDLCATALFSFQGTNTNASPYRAGSFDRTGVARRQSHDEQYIQAVP